MRCRTMLLLAWGFASWATGCRAADPAAPAAPPAARARLGINLNGPADWNSELPFVDVFRLSRTWISQREGAGWGQGPRLELDARGWVKRLEPHCSADTPLCTIPGGRYPQGRYVCLYRGQGTIELREVGRIISSAPGRIEFESKPGTGAMWLSLRAVDPADPIRDLRVVMPGFEASYQTEPFHPAFLKRWQGYDTYRFMDWQKTNGSPIRTWDDRPRTDDATWTTRGIPLEVMVDLCNRQQANPWFCLPHQADDDFVRRFAELVKERLDPKLKVYVEYSNEVWNSTFEQARYAQAKGKELALGDAARPWEGGGMYHARRSVEIFRIWSEVLGRERLVRVLAWQAVGAWWFENILLMHGDTAANVDALAIAPYLSFLIPARSTNNRPDAATVAGWTVDQVLDHTAQQALPASLKAMQEVQAIAARRGLLLLGYEAGQHLVGVQGGENNDGLTELLKAANRHPRMGAIYTQYLDGWAAAGGDLLCLFSSVGTWSKWGSWGLAEYWDETEADQPKLQAAMDWHRQHPR